MTQVYIPRTQRCPVPRPFFLTETQQIICAFNIFYARYLPAKSRFYRQSIDLRLFQDAAILHVMMRSVQPQQIQSCHSVVFPFILP